MFFRFAYNSHHTSSFAILLVNTTPFPFAQNTSWGMDSELKYKPFALHFLLLPPHPLFSQHKHWHILIPEYHSIEWNTLCCVILASSREFWKASLKLLQLNIITRHNTVANIKFVCQKINENDYLYANFKNVLTICWYLPALNFSSTMLYCIPPEFY